MCYWCHDKRHNPGAPSHRSQNCRDPKNSWSTVNQQQAQHQIARGGGGGKPPCKYGSSCYRTCPIHRAKYDHSSGTGAVAVAVPVVRLPGQLLWEIQSRGGVVMRASTLKPGREAWIWDGVVWHDILNAVPNGDNIRVSWAGVCHGAPENAIDLPK
jgi:hypothetical protein